MKQEEIEKEQGITFHPELISDKNYYNRINPDFMKEKKYFQKNNKKILKYINNIQKMKIIKKSILMKKKKKFMIILLINCIKMEWKNIEKNKEKIILKILWMILVKMIEIIMLFSKIVLLVMKVRSVVRKCIKIIIFDKFKIYIYLKFSDI